jgi:hypothetical protein
MQRLSLLAMEAVARIRSQLAASSSMNAVSFSSARTTKRFPSRCASAIQMVRPSQSIAETQPKLQPRFLRHGQAPSRGGTQKENYLAPDKYTPTKSDRAKINAALI